MPITESQARQALQKLLQDFNRLTADERRQMSEASVVRQFVDRLLEEVLGWPIKDPARYKYEMFTQAGRPDLTLIPESGGTIFIEAKKFGIIKELEQARYTVAGTITPGQLALPGMAVDRTEEEQQAINYAFANGGMWAILTNFEKLRLFNARRDWLVLSFERPHAYLDDFDLLWQLAYPNVLNGSLDALSSQRLTKDVDTKYLQFINAQRETLARDAVKRWYINPWAFLPDGGLNLPLLRAAIQRFLDRLVIIRFAEDHLVIPPGTLRELYEVRQRNPYTFSLDQFLGQFFYRFDEEHNSALFAQAVADWASFGDDVLLPLIAKLYEARYRAMPADIIGNTYEQYLGTALALDNGSVTTRDNLETRKKQGSYYTPQVIVRYLVDTTLGRYLYGTQDGKPDGAPVAGERRKTSLDVRDLRVLDGACGSGSFLIYAYQVLADFYEGEMRRLEEAAEVRRQELVAQGMTDPFSLQIELTPFLAERERIRDYPRLILETHLYGVDLDPQAAEIAVVNLMMRALEGRHREKRLPLILGQNVKVGNALVGSVSPGDAVSPAEIADLIRLRRLLTTDPDRNVPRPDRPIDRYRGVTLEEAQAVPNPTARDRAVAAVMQRMQNPILPEPDLSATHPTYYETLTKTRALADRLDAPCAAHFTDLERVRPFHWGVEFPEIFFDAEGKPLDDPGFTIVVGNPPWEILKPDLREFYAQFDADIESKLNRQQTEKRIAELEAEDPRRRALWESLKTFTEETAAWVRRSPDYTRQGKGDTATHKLFVERMYGLLRGGGRLGYVVPSGIYTDLGTKELREMLLDEGNIQYIYSFSNERGFFPAVHHAFKFTLLGVQKGSHQEGFWAAFRFNPRVAVAPEELPSFLDNPANLVYVRLESLERFSPDSLSVMEFRSQQDYRIAEIIYDGWPLLGDQIPETWNVGFTREFDMTNDRHLFNSIGQGLSLYEGKMFYQFDAFHTNG